MKGCDDSMDLYIMDGLNGVTDVVDNFKSVIWNVQYFDRNDFQLVAPATKENLNALQMGRYIVRGEDADSGTYKNVMIIESYSLDYDIENGWLITVAGKGLKNIVGQRIVWTQTNLTGNAEAGLRQIISENIINPSNNDRKISNFILSALNNFTDMIEMQLFGENIAEWLVEICKTYGWGWDVYISGGKYVFSLYKGTDRTFNQNDVDPVIFSPDFDNLLSSSYSFNRSEYQNAALIGGEGEGTSQRTATIGTATGLDRYEAYIDGGSVSSNGEIITAEQYEEMLKEYGQTQLNLTKFNENFSGEIDADGVFKINQDFYLGDLVQIINEKGINATSRIIEIIYAEDESGLSVVPTFSEWGSN